ncbi:hypothetical protein PC9H_008118 [Pleurotus ostreatus]|uniref:Uncharacterized protein n=1 Tax=Pleurotus ostreatus TaxID=5322 RepID=A0A8H6ZUV0_PLEOS|nr:uncharacterized protein PC9H_008118 [Pleurotus ostreatus]KAF7428886.1 hypothetical protein PC9H_008118 [Pleurotus ostreatus]
MNNMNLNIHTMFAHGLNEHYTRFPHQQNPFPAISTPPLNDYLTSSGFVSPGVGAAEGSVASGDRDMGQVAQEIRGLVQSAVQCTERMTTKFNGISFMRTDMWREVSELCWSLRHCLRAPPEIRHSYLPPVGSTWSTRRASLVVSLKRLSEHLATKPLRIDKFRHQLSKLSAYHAKFSYLFSRIKASSDKMRLMQLRDVYQEACRMLRDQLEEERKRRREAQAHFVLKASHIKPKAHILRQRPNLTNVIE